jgi:molybdenum cofactor cytidylyltransferase
VRIVGVLLAAGSGSRFGGGKLVHPVGEHAEPLAHIAWRHLRDAVSDVIVVVRAGDAAVEQVFREAGAAITICEDSNEGMGRSLACGIRGASGADGWIVALGDMPLVRPETIRRVAAALAGGASIAIPVHEGRRGHPVGFAAKHGPALIGLQGDEGARRIVGADPGQVVEVDVDDPGILADVDTREDASRLADAGR